MQRQIGLFATKRAALLLWLAAAAAPAQDAPPSCQLRITSTPDACAIAVDGTPRDVTPRVLSDLAPGEHLLVLSKPGYATLRRNVTLSPDQRLALDLQLEPLTGLVLIRSDPDGAEIRLGGTDRGKTPLLLTDLKAGTYQIEVAAQGYTSRTVALEIKNRKPQLLNVALASDSASVALESEPPGARVLINGIDSGLTPCTADRVPAGDVFLKMELTGFAPTEQILKLRAGQKDSVKLVLKPLPAELQVVSIPAGARIYLNNQFRGPTPLTLTGLDAGSYRIRAELDGFAPEARTVELVRAQKLTEEFRLEGNLGIFQLVTEPAGVKVFIDGMEKGVTKAPPQKDDSLSEALLLRGMAVGEHQVQLTKEGFAPKEFKLVILKNQTATQHMKLQRLFIPNYEVKTSGGTERGMLLGIDSDGTIRLETRPGVVSTIRPRDIISSRNLR